MEEKKDTISRKDFIKGAGLSVAGLAISAVISDKAHSETALHDLTGDQTIREIPEFKTVKGNRVDPLIRMQKELRKAMAKPIEQRKWKMIIDTRKCVGCHACTVACISENKLPPGVVYRPVVLEESGIFPNVQLKFFPRPCMQCDSPPCVPVCPVDATWKRPDGVVVIDYDACIGCQLCIEACPYGARTYDEGQNYTDNTPQKQPYEMQSNNEYGKLWDRNKQGSPVGNARKCHFCVNRLEKGELPQCVTTCIARANYFGDVNDSNSLVAQKSREINQIKLLEEKGTKPQVTYLV